MRTILLAAGLLFGALFCLYGALLLMKPDAFIRFHYALFKGDGWGHPPAWYGNVRDGEYKVLGIMMFAFGVFVVGSMLTTLIS